MSGDEPTTVTVEFTPAEYERLVDVTDDPAEFLRSVAQRRLATEESIEFTRDGGFRGPDGFARMMDDDYPNWPLGSHMGIDLQSMGDGECQWTLDVRPEHMNPMGTIHGGVLCDIGDAAVSTAYMSTLEAGESFTTVDLTVNFLRPVWEGELEAVGTVIHRGRTIGVSECEITDADDKLVARLSGTCMTLREESADRVEPPES